MVSLRMIIIAGTFAAGAAVGIVPTVSDIHRENALRTAFDGFHVGPRRTR